MNEERQFATYLVALAEMCQYFTLKPEITALYDEAAAKIGYQKACIALKHIISKRNSKDPFPSISELFEVAAFNNLDPEEVAMKITGAVTRFGNYRSADARIYLGELAWEIVQVEGGWESVCQMLNYENMSTLQAQWRRLAGILIQRKKTEEMERIGFLEPISSVLPEGIKRLIGQQT